MNIIYFFIKTEYPLHDVKIIYRKNKFTTVKVEISHSKMTPNYVSSHIFILLVS